MDPIRPTAPAASGVPAAASGGAERLAAERLGDGRAPQLAPPAPARAAAAPLRRGLPVLDDQLQGDVASAQQALDYLEHLSAQLQALKSDLSAKLSNRANGRQLEARVRQLAATVNARQRDAGGSVNAQLDFSGPAPASQQFRIQDLDLDALQAGPARVLSLSIGNGVQPQPVSIEPGLSRKEIVRRFDRALAPANVRAGTDADGALVFSTPESAWPGVRDSLAIQGRGRVAAEAEPAALAPQGWGGDDSEALRQNLREVVQALTRVMRSRDAASVALSAATNRSAAAQPSDAGIGTLAQDFVATASTPHYDALVEISSALAGVSRERVISLLGLR